MHFMEAQALTIVLHDDSPGYEITPARVPLAALRGFAKDVDEFLRGDGGDVDTSSLDVAVVKGSLALSTAPIANPVLLGDLQRLCSDQRLDGISVKRRGVVERWQKAARGPRHLKIEIQARFLNSPIVINADTDFRADDADQWVRVERYVKGEIEDMGGHGKANAHVRLPDGKLLVVDASKDVLRDEKVNRLYKTAMVRITAEFNVMTREYRSARLIEFVEHDNRVDEKALERLFSRGARAWQSVPDAGEWVDSLRGSGD